MNSSSRQLPLGLPHHPRFTRESFIPAPCNVSAFEMVCGAADWPERMLLIEGASGSGKTHLARMWAAETGARLIDAIAVRACDVPQLVAEGRIVIEDLHQLEALGDEERARVERGLFHIYNLARSEGAHLLFTSRKAPSRMIVNLPDLRSRLMALAVMTLGEPDDTLLGGVLEKLLLDRQLTYSETLIPYLLLRMERSLDAATTLVEDLDALALASRQRLTPRLAKTILEKNH